MKISHFIKIIFATHDSHKFCKITHKVYHNCQLPLNFIANTKDSLKFSTQQKSFELALERIARRAKMGQHLRDVNLQK